MTSVTFLINATANLGIDLIDTYSHIDTNQSDIELIAYQADETQWVNNHIQTVAKSDNSLQQAIVTAAGEWIVFAKPNVISMRYSDILGLIQNHSSCDLLMPITKDSKLMRLFSDVTYFAIRKSYLLSDHLAKNDLKQIIKDTDYSLRATFVEPLSGIADNDLLLQPFSYAKPFRKIIKARICNHLNEIKRKKDEKHAQRLSENVLRVHYSNDIPVFIINRDRYEPLLKLIAWLEDEGLKNIHIVDNASTYPPLMKYYESTPYHVVRLNYNSGHTSPWKDGIVQLYAGGGAYIVTDPDIIPDKNAHGAVKRFAELLNTYLERRKVGFGLRIDNLPDAYHLKKHVISWEKQFWESTVETDVYDAEIDTTFALYRPGTPYILGPGLRTGGQFIAEHEPWYTDSENPSEEIKYYRAHANKTIGTWGADSSEANTLYEHSSVK